MFEYRMSYRSSRFHKEGEKPFIFPPEYLPSKIDANIIEIEGDNGTGKTTFLNCIALALGYLDERKELEQKKRLVRRLQSLNENKTLSYYFNISSTLPDSPCIVAERQPKQDVKYEIDSAPADLIDLKKQFDVIFLTDDDPRKDVKNSLRVLSNNFKENNDRLESITGVVGLYLQKIKEYKEFKNKEKELLSEIEERKKKIEKANSEKKRINNVLQQIELRDEIRSKVELYKNRTSIKENYDRLKIQYEKLESVEEPTLVQKVMRLKIKRSDLNSKKSSCEAQIGTIIKSLALNDIKIDQARLLLDDWTQFNRLRKQYPGINETTIQQTMLSDMLALFNRYRGDDMVPYFDQPVEKIVEGLTKEKSKLAREIGQHRVFGLLNSLEIALHNRKAILIQLEKTQDKITEYSSKIRNLEKFEKIEKEFREASTKFFDLKTIKNDDISKLMMQWSELSLVKGDKDILKGQLLHCDVAVRTEGQLLSRAEQNLTLLQESASRKPKYLEKEKNLDELSEKVLVLRNKLDQMITILEKDYKEPPDYVTSSRKKANPKLPIEDEFIEAVGAFIGSAFEPVDYNYQKWEIKSYNLKRETFVTQDDREIDLEELSRGQTRLVTLIKVLKEMQPGEKRKVLLVDEIADLDATRLEWVRKTMKEKLEEGSLMLAVMVRPRTSKEGDIVKITGCN